MRSNDGLTSNGTTKRPADVGRAPRIPPTLDMTIDWFSSLAGSRRRAVWPFAGLFLFLIVPTVLMGQSVGVKPCERDQSPPIFSVAGTSEQAARAFLVALQKAVANDDRRKVASMIRYPIVIRARNRNLLFKTAASLAASYRLIFTAALKKTIAEARTECLFTNSQGVMIHDGEIWMAVHGRGDLQIITINRPVSERGQLGPQLPRAIKVHPKVFSLIKNFAPDSEYPVVTEISLDAVEVNGNQFPSDEIKQEGEWVTWTIEDGRGFKRYQIIETTGSRYTVEYQENDGGTLTTSAIIEFVVERRVLRKDGKPRSIRVLRVLAFSTR